MNGMSSFLPLLLLMGSFPLSAQQKPTDNVAPPKSDTPASPAIRITLFGTSGGPFAQSERAGPSALIEAGTERFLIDAGRDAVQRMAQAKMPPNTVTRIFLTHLHSDHVVSLPDIWLSGWWMGRKSPLEVLGPPGTHAMAQHLEEAFAFDTEIRNGPPENLPKDTSKIIGTDVSEGVVFEHGGVRVSAITVDHGPVKPAYGYRIDYAGHSVVFSGDDRRSENLIAKSQNVDVLFHNMTGYTPEQLAEPGRGGIVRRAGAQLLASPEDAGDVFTRSHCRAAVLIHTSRDENSLSRLRSHYKGRLDIGDDLNQIDVGDEIIVRVLPH